MSNLLPKSGQFRLYRRGKIWYYWTYDDYGKRHRYSTGERRKSDAFEFCMKRKEAGCLLQIRREKAQNRNITLDEFGWDFWDYDTCPIVQGKILRGGHYGKKVALANGSRYRQHISPFLGKRKLQDLSRAEIEKWLLNLPGEHKLANKSANNCYSALRQMLDHAVYARLITENPMNGMKPLVNKTVRHEAFSMEQIKALFLNPWENEWAFTACYLASRTGMRIGEVRALTKEQIFPDYINVNASWSEYEGRKTTKSDYERKVPINRELHAMLMKYAPPGGGLLFSLNGLKPVRDQFITNRLKSKMDQINKEKGFLFFDYENPKRPLSFHSFRHFLNTRLLAENMPDSKIRAIIGHESNQMTEHYAHLNADDLATLRKIQNSL